VTLSQLEGPTALAYLKDDLNDRARIRSEGKVKEVIVYGLVAE
jgi:flagellar FliL protein